MLTEIGIPPAERPPVYFRIEAASEAV